MKSYALSLLFVLTLWSSMAQAQTSGDKGVVRIGAKNFTEQEIVAEITAQAIEGAMDVRVERRFGLGGTEICHAAITSGELDVYIEYTGTALLNVLNVDDVRDARGAFELVEREYRERFEIAWLAPLGFNNTYALAVREADAAAQGLENVSDLAGTDAELRAGFTSEFMERPDGYPGLRRVYGLEFARTMDLEPGLMYQALVDGQVDVICAFATDGRVEAYGLRLLVDDREFFPPYEASVLVRMQAMAEHPRLREVLAEVSGAISDRDMRAMNHAVDVEGLRPRAVARAWLESRSEAGQQGALDLSSAPARASGLIELARERKMEILRKTWEHLLLTLVGVGIAIVVGLPLGIVIARRPGLRAPTLALTEVVQTIPSLAMLAFLFALYGLLGAAPAVTALSLYALLPIVLNTFVGLREIPAQIVQAADGVGMSSWQRLRMVELPLAAPMIIAGIRAATVLTVGIATLSTYIGAGGLGDFIARGLARNDPRLTLLGAIPAAALAVTLSLLIRLGERMTRRS